MEHTVDLGKHVVINDDDGGKRLIQLIVTALSSRNTQNKVQETHKQGHQNLLLGRVDACMDGTITITVRHDNDDDYDISFMFGKYNTLGLSVLACLDSIKLCHSFSHSLATRKQGST